MGTPPASSQQTSHGQPTSQPFHSIALTSHRVSYLGPPRYLASSRRGWSRGESLQPCQLTDLLRANPAVPAPHDAGAGGRRSAVISSRAVDGAHRLSRRRDHAFCAAARFLGSFLRCVQRCKDGAHGSSGSDSARIPRMPRTELRALTRLHPVGHAPEASAPPVPLRRRALAGVRCSRAGMAGALAGVRPWRPDCPDASLFADSNRHERVRHGCQDGARPCPRSLAK